MEIRDYILVISAIVVVVGWFVNSYLNQRHEISIRRADYRVDALKSYISFYAKAIKTKSLTGFDDVQVSYYLYGYDDEIQLVKRIANIVTTQPGNKNWFDLLIQLNVLTRNRLRAELGLPYVKI